jgi:hypothetical protein
MCKGVRCLFQNDITGCNIIELLNATPALPIQISYE